MEIKSYFKLKKIDGPTLAEDIEANLRNDHTSLSNKVDHYNTTLWTLLDKHAPLKDKEIKVSHEQPWFCDKIKSEIILCRKKEWTWKQHPTEYNYMAFYYQRRYIANIMRMAQKNYYKEKLLENKYCTKEIYRIANTEAIRK